MSTPTPTHKPDTEHELLTYVRVGKVMDNHDSNTYNIDPGAMEMKKKTPLTKALDSMSDIASIQLPVDVPKDVAFTVAGVDAGTLYAPKVDAILEKSTESSFGRGSETVLDPSYRSGREIPATDLGLQNLQKFLSPDIKRFMFPGREVELKLYKLAVYEIGGHFDWHMDSTHSDKHHGTLLVALNTSWDGGNLMLRRNGVETAVDLRPKWPHSWATQLQAVAFFTDTEHRVEPVKSGIRIVLQYDVELFKKREDEDKAEEKSNERDEDEGEDEDDEGEGDEDEEDDDEATGPWMDCIQRGDSERRGVAQAKADKTALKKVLSIIKRLHTKGTKEVAFALQHLYRSASISAEYLKGSDATLYNTLLASGDFDVSLHPVLFSEETDCDGIIKERHVYRYNREKVKDKVDEWEDDGEDEDEDESPRPSKRQKLGGEGERTLFHIPELSGFTEISRTDYIEYTGNEAVPAKYRYFGGGMFVRPKDR